MRIASEFIHIEDKISLFLTHVSNGELNAMASSNIVAIDVNLCVFQLLISWLKAEALRKRRLGSTT